MPAQVRSPLIVDQNLLDPDARENRILGGDLDISLRHHEVGAAFLPLLAAGALASGAAYAYTHRRVPIKEGETWDLTFHAPRVYDSAEFLTFVAQFQREQPVTPVSSNASSDQRFVTLRVKFNAKPDLHFGQGFRIPPSGLTFKLQTAGPVQTTTNTVGCGMVGGPQLRALSNVGAALFTPAHMAKLATPAGAKAVMAAARSKDPKKSAAAQTLLATAASQARRGVPQARKLVGAVKKQYATNDVVVVEPGGKIRRVPRSSVKGL